MVFPSHVLGMPWFTTGTAMCSVPHVSIFSIDRTCHYRLILSLGGICALPIYRVFSYFTSLGRGMGCVPWVHNMNQNSGIIYFVLCSNSYIFDGVMSRVYSILHSEACHYWNKFLANLKWRFQTGVYSINISMYKIGFHTTRLISIQDMYPAQILTVVFVVLAKMYLITSQ